MADEVDRMMKTQPNYSSADLARIRRPVAVVHAEHGEFILRDHAEYLARTMPNARLILLDGASHFAPWQKPDEFNDAMRAFIEAG